MDEVMIAFNGVTKRYGDREAISDLSFNVEYGEFFGYLGPNGAGKTTSIKSMIGLVRPDAGSIIIDGFDVTRDPLAVRRITGYVPDSPFVYGKLTAREFLGFVGSLYHMKPAEIEKGIDWLGELFDMHGWIDRRCEEYSHGMKQRVVMSAAFIHRPKLIIVDEPTVGLDPPGKRLLKDMLRMICDEGATIFMSSHDLSEVEELCGRIAILHHGSIVAEGTLADLRRTSEMEGGSLEDLFLKLTGSIRKTAYRD